MAEVLWTLKDVTLHGDAVHRLDSVSLEIQVGTTAIMGPSGAGKTSLLSVLAQLERPHGGQIVFHPPKPSNCVFSLPLFWVPQDGGLWPHMTARQQLEAVLPSANGQRHSRNTGESGNEVDKLLNDFDLQHREAAFPAELSKGEQSRLSVARCLLANAAVMLMDEPFAHVDQERHPKYWDVVRQHMETHSTSLVFTTHEPHDAIRESQNVICFDAGRVILAGKTTEVFRDPSNNQ